MADILQIFQALIVLFCAALTCTTLGLIMKGGFALIKWLCANFGKLLLDSCILGVLTLIFSTLGFALLIAFDRMFS
jgi:hypothetical protein